MKRLLNIIFSMLALSQGHRRHTEGTVASEGNTGQFRPDLRLIETALKQIEASDKADQALQHEKLEIERKRLRLEKRMCWIVVIGTSGALLNLWFLKGSLDSARRSADAARDSANAARTASETASTQMVTEQRAWLRIATNAHIQLNEFAVTYSIANDGKTPARGINGCIAARVFKNTDVPDFQCGQGHPGFGQSLRFIAGNTPDQVLGNIPVFALGEKTIRRVVIDSRFRTDWTTGAIYVAAYGRFTFTDVFDIDHWFQFCNYVRNGALPVPNRNTISKGETACAEYNNFDSNASKQGQRPK